MWPWLCMVRSGWTRLGRWPIKRIMARQRHAFTLIEVLIVVVILGILAAIVVPKFSNASDQPERIPGPNDGAAPYARRRGTSVATRAAG